MRLSSVCLVVSIAHCGASQLWMSRSWRSGSSRVIQFIKPIELRTSEDAEYDELRNPSWENCNAQEDERAGSLIGAELVKDWRRKTMKFLTLAEKRATVNTFEGQINALIADCTEELKEPVISQLRSFRKFQIDGQIGSLIAEKSSVILSMMPNQDLHNFAKTLPTTKKFDRIIKTRKVNEMRRKVAEYRRVIDKSWRIACDFYLDLFSAQASESLVVQGLSLLIKAASLQKRQEYAERITSAEIKV